MSVAMNPGAIPTQPMPCGASATASDCVIECTAALLAPHGIGCVGIAPGFIATDMTADLLESPAGQAIRAQSPFGRVATPREVALAIMALAEPQAEWASGSIVDFNGASYLH